MANNLEKLITKSTFTSICRKYTEEKENSDYFKLNYLSKNDLEVCNYVSSILPCLLTYRNSNNEITKNELISKSLTEFRKLDSTNIFNLINIINTIEFISEPLLHHFSIKISYSSSKNGHKASVFQYVIPNKLYDFDVYGFTHEHCHALKDTNLLELKDTLILGEVIPIFYELFTFDGNDISKKIMLEERLCCLYNNKCLYDCSNKYIFEEQGCYHTNYDPEEYHLRTIYEYVRSYLGLYINSFYYAVILYNMYKINPKKMLSYISKVLSQELTTYEMLVQLGIYADIKGEIFEKELNSIKRTLKI